MWIPVSQLPKSWQVHGGKEHDPPGTLGSWTCTTSQLSVDKVLTFYCKALQNWMMHQPNCQRQPFWWVLNFIDHSKSYWYENRKSKSNTNIVKSYLLCKHEQQNYKKKISQNGCIYTCIWKCHECVDRFTYCHIEPLGDTVTICIYMIHEVSQDLQQYEIWYTVMFKY